MNAWEGITYINDKPVEKHKVAYDYTEQTYTGEVFVFSLPTCSDPDPTCDSPDVRVSEAAADILSCSPLKKEFEERGNEMPYSEIINKIYKYKKEGRCRPKACVAGSGGAYCAVPNTDAMKVATCMATDCNY